MVAEKGAESNERLNSGAVENVKHAVGMVSTTNPIVHRRGEQGLDEPWRELTASVN